MVHQTQSSVRAAARCTKDKPKESITLGLLLLQIVLLMQTQKGNTIVKDILMYVPVCMVMDQNVECVGVALSFTDEAFNSSLSTVIHLYNITFSLLFRPTPLV